MPRLAVLWLLLLAATASTADPGLEYVITFPGYIMSGEAANFNFLMPCNCTGGQFTLELWRRPNEDNGTDTVLQSQTYDVDNGPTSLLLVFEVPVLDPDQYYNLYIRITGTLSGVSFSDQSDVTLLQTSQNVVIVQTDKSQYRAGERVYYRIIILNSDLLPVQNQTGNVTVRNPDSQIIIQMLDVEFGEGLIQNSFDLLEVAAEGFWTIRVDVAGTQGSTVFEVTVFTLPTFSVTITPDPDDIITNPTISYTICAVYTFNQPVKGTIEIFASSYDFYYPPNRKPVVHRIDEIDGCYNYTLNLSLLQTNEFPSYSGYFPFINLTAIVTEGGTGVSVSATNLLSRSTARILLNFNRPARPTNDGPFLPIPPNQDNSFKVGLAYTGVLYVQERDGSRIAGVLIQICVFVRSDQFFWRQWNTYRKLACRNFTSNEDGIVYFTLPPFGTRVTQVYVTAFAVNYPTIEIPNGPTLEQPSAFLRLSPFYSRYGNSIKVVTINVDTLPCRATYSALILMNVVPDCTYDVNFILIVGTEIVSSEVISKTFPESALYAQQPDDTYVVNGPPPPGSQQPVIGIPENQRRNVVNFTYTFTLPSDASPRVKLLVYYVERDSSGNPVELVSDLAEFDVARCYENEVSLEFEPTQALPGSNVSIIVTATGNSLCGIGAVDKGVTLLPGYEERNSRQSVLDQLRYLNYQDYSTFLVNQSYCFEGPYRYPTEYETSNSRRSKRDLQAPNIDYMFDSLTPFENAAVVILSNIPAQTRPCPNLEFPGYPDGQIVLPGSIFFPGPFPNRIRGDLAAGAAPPMASSVEASTVEGQNTVRSFFPETWLWQVVRVSPDGRLVYQETLPDTITTWQGTALCIHPTAGFGISEVANVTGFQPLFVTITLPPFLRRGEEATIIVTAFSYIEQCILVRVSLQGIQNLDLISTPSYPCALLCGGSSSESFRYYVTPTAIGTGNLTATVESGPDIPPCRSTCPSISPLNASDTVLESIQIRPEGFPVRDITTLLLCANGSAPGVSIPLTYPPDLVDGSRTVVVVVTGDILGIAVNNIGTIPPFTYAYAETTLAILASSVYLYDYLRDTNQLTSDLDVRLTSVINTAYQQQFMFRAPDGSYAAFGSSDFPRSVYLTAFAIRALTAAASFVGNTTGYVSESIRYVLQAQDPVTGCFRENDQETDDDFTGPDLSLFVGISLLLAGYNDPELNGQIAACAEAQNLPRNETLAMYAYFSALTNNVEKASSLLDTLFENADTSSGYIFWVDPNYYSLTGTAGYVILTVAELGRNLGEVQPIVRWLTERINFGFFYAYSVAYAVSVQALTRYSTAVYSPQISVTVTVTAVYGPGSTTPPRNITFTITNRNRLVYQQRVLQDPTAVGLTIDVAQGSQGCFLIQSQQLYYVSNSPPQRGLQLNVSAVATADCAVATLTICVRFSEGFLPNAAVVDITLLSGYSIDIASLQLLVDAGVIVRFTTNGNSVLLFIQRLYQTATCFEVRERRIVIVTDLQPAQVRLYDYFNRDNSASAQYEVGDDCVPLATNGTSTNLTNGDEVIFE